MRKEPLLTFVLTFFDTSTIDSIPRHQYNSMEIYGSSIKLNKEDPYVHLVPPPICKKV